MNIMEICFPCSGSGVLGEFTNPVIHNCPWCNNTGTVTKEMNDAHIRVSKITPNNGKFCKVWGNGRRAEKPIPRKA